MEDHCDSTYWNKSNLIIIISISIVIAVIITIYGLVKEIILKYYKRLNEEQYLAVVRPF